MADTPNIPKTDLERQEQWKKRANAFWNIFLPIKNGKVKSTLIIYSFCLSILFLAAYAMSYHILLDVLDPILSGKISTFWVNVAESIIPALAGTLFCNIFHFLFSEKRLIPAAYAWLLFYAIAITVYLLVSSPAGFRGTIFKLLMMFIAPSIFLGLGLSLFLYLRYRKLHPLAVSVEKAPLWKQDNR